MTRILRSLIALCLVLAWSLPVVFERGTVGDAASQDVLLIVDRSTSMGATDHLGKPRLEGVAADIRLLTETLHEARFAVVTIDNEARVVLPWTTDTTALTTLAGTLGWRDDGQGSGTDIGVGAQAARTLLEESRTRRPRALRHVVYLGDGEHTAQAPPTPMAPLGALSDGALVLGYGTGAGATMLTRPGSTERVSRDGQQAVSRLDEGRLREIAEQLGGTYEHRTDDGPLPLWPGAAATTVEVSPDTGFSWSWALGATALALAVLELARTAAGARRRWKELR